MTDPTARELIQRLASELETWIEVYRGDELALVNEARAYLARMDATHPRPIPVASLSDVDVEQTAFAFSDVEVERCSFICGARWAEHRLAHPQAPIPVAERWPEFSDCDHCERVWAFNPVLRYWRLTHINQLAHTFWLPATALPLP